LLKTETKYINNGRTVDLTEHIGRSFLKFRCSGSDAPYRNLNLPTHTQPKLT